MAGLVQTPRRRGTRRWGRRSSRTPRTPPGRWWSRRGCCPPCSCNITWTHPGLDTVTPQNLIPLNPLSIENTTRRFQSWMFIVDWPTQSGIIRITLSDYRVLSWWKFIPCVAGPWAHLVRQCNAMCDNKIFICRNLLATLVSHINNELHRHRPAAGCRTHGIQSVIAVQQPRPPPQPSSYWMYHPETSDDGGFGSFDSKLSNITSNISQTSGEVEEEVNQWKKYFHFHFIGGYILWCQQSKVRSLELEIEVSQSQGKP